MQNDAKRDFTRKRPAATWRRVATRATMGAAVAGVMVTSPVVAQQAPASDRPNIVLMVVDDLGYSDLGAFGGEIATPNLDALIAEGVQLTNFYAAPACSPTRSMLMSGTDNHIAGLGNMAELLVDEQRGRPGYEGFLNDRVVAFPQYLQDAGYNTYMAGKWHLGAKPELLPASRGFEKSLAMMAGAASHFNQGGAGVLNQKASYFDGMEPFTLPDPFYSTDFYTDKIIEYMKSEPADQPFMAYVAYTAPHWPLQAPRESIDKYRGKYDAGYEVVREARIARMKELELLAPDAEAAVPNAKWPTWADLTPEQQAREARLMETYAGMIDRLDYNVGRIVDYLKDSGEYDNTIFVFMSDNGAEGNDPEQTVAENRAWLAENFDNSIDNIGNATSYVGYGPVWGQVSSAPFRMFKGFTYEGGIHVPAFVTAPGRLKPGRNSGLMSVMDIAPTLLDYAQVPQPGTEYKGKQIEPIEGVSQVAALSGQAPARGAEDTVGWELFGRTAVRDGDWKLVWSNKPFGTGNWELFDLSTDPAEARDLAASNPDKLAEMMKDWDAYQQANGVVWNEGLVDQMYYSNNDVHFAPAQ